MTMNIDIKEVPLAPENPLAFRQRLKAARRLAWIHRSTVGVKLISIVCLELGRAAVGRG